jgi:hypothetical protein
MSRKSASILVLLAAAAAGVGWVSAAGAARETSPTIVSITDHVDERGVSHREWKMSDGSSYQGSLS